MDLEGIRRIPIATIAAELRIPTRNGSTNCPFPDHRDANPSFQLLRRVNGWRCHGCGRKGSNIDLVMQLNDWNFVTAVTWLQERFVCRIPSNLRIPATRPKLAPVTSRESECAPDNEVYNWILKSSPLCDTGRKYLLSRHISDQTLLKFRIGQIADAGVLLSDSQKVFGLERLHRAGLIRKFDSGTFSSLVFDSGYLLFPFLDGDSCQYLQARAVGASSSGPRWKSLHQLMPPIYNMNALRSEGDIFLCEGVTDVLSAHELRRTAFALLGANARVPSMCVDMLKGRTVYILPDNDRAGRSMGKRLREQFAKLGIDAVVQSWPDGIKDVNEYLASVRS